MKKITALFLALLLLSTLMLGNALTAKKAYAYSLKVDNVTSQIDSENNVNWDIPIETVYHSDGEEFFSNLQAVYDNDQIIITRQENENTLRIEIDAQLYDTIEYTLVNNNCIVDNGQITPDENSIVDGKYVYVFEDLHIFEGINVFTVSRTRGDEVIRNGLTFTYSPMMRLLSESGVVAPEISVDTTEGYLISWNTLENVDFNVYRSENGFEYFLLSTVYADSFQYSYLDEDYDVNKTYYYAVKTITGTETSDYSNTVCVKNKPLNVTGIKISTSGSSNLVQWNASNGAEWYEVAAIIDGEETCVNVIGLYVELTGEIITNISVTAYNDLGNQVEAMNTISLEADSDADGLTNAEELLLGTDPYKPDSDGDGLTDGFEITLGTNPLIYDTDEDGISDGAEIVPKLYFEIVDGVDIYKVSKPLDDIEIDFYGDQNMFASSIISAHNASEFLNTLSKSVLYPIDVYAQNADYINLSFDLSNVTPYSTKENLRLYCVNNETKQLEIISDTVYENDHLIGTVYSTGTYIVADQSVQMDFSLEVVILVEKQYSDTYNESFCYGHLLKHCLGHETKTCLGHETKTCLGHAFCPGHYYACIVHYHCNGGLPDCILRLTQSISMDITPLTFTTTAIPPSDDLWYCPGCQTIKCTDTTNCTHYSTSTIYCTDTTNCTHYSTTTAYCTDTIYCTHYYTTKYYCAGCQTITRVIDTRYDDRFTEINVATGILNSLNDELFQIGIAQNTEYGIKAVFSDTFEEKLSVLNAMRVFYTDGTLGADLSNALNIFSNEENNKKIIYIRHNGDADTLITKIQSAYALGIETDVISMYSETDADYTTLEQAAYAGNGSYYGVDYSATDSDKETRIKEICDDIRSTWEVKKWVYNGGQIENLQPSYSNMYAGLDSEEISQWISTASTNLLTGGYINQSVDINNYGGNGYLSILRTYNSLTGNTLGYFGKGYSSVFDCKVVEGDESTAVVTNVIAKLYLSEDGVEVRKVSKGTELVVLTVNENYTKVKYDEKEYYILNSDISCNNRYTVYLPTGGTEKFIFENETYTPLGTLGKFYKFEDSFEYVSQDHTSYTFDSNGRIVCITDKSGEKMFFEYAENQITVSDLYGNTITATLVLDKISSLSMNGSTDCVNYSYNEDRLVTVNWYGIKEENYSYNYITGSLDEIMDADDNIVLDLEYDLLGRIKTKYMHVNESVTTKESFFYDNINSAVYAIKANGTILKVTYNAFLEPISETYIDSDSIGHELWRKEYYYYDSVAGQWIEYTACVNGDAVFIQCQTLKQQGANKKEIKIEQVYVDGIYVDACTATEYDARGNILSVTDNNGTDDYTYNDMDCILTHTDKLDQTETYNYDATGVYIISTVDALNRVTAYEYSENLFADSILKQLTSVTYPNGETLDLLYDDYGNIISETKTYLDETSCTTRQYNTSGKVTSVTNPTGGITTYTYTLCGEVASVRDEYTKTYEYDANGRLIIETSENENVTKYVRSLSGNIVTKTISNHDVVIYQEDYTYDSCGNLIRKEIANGAVYEYAYDYANRLIAEREIRTAADETEVIRVKSCVYDYNGLMTMSTDYMGNITLYGYDINKNLIKTVEVIDAENTRVTLYEYDALGRQTRVTYASGAYESAQYDAIGRVTLSKDKLGNDTTYEYNDENNIAKVTDQNGNITVNYYGLFGVIKESSVTAGLDENDHPILIEDKATEYFYDANGNVTGKILPNGLEYAYTYDYRNRLTQTDEYDNNGALLATSSSSYDSVNNLTQETARNVLAVSYGYDELNRLVSTSSTVNSVTSITSYEYDADNRLTKITDALGQETVYQYVYSTADYLTVNTVYPSGAITKTAYDALDRVIKETDALNNVTTCYYDALGNLAAVMTGDRLTQYDYDIMGNNTALTDARGNVTSFTYDNMGRMTAKTNADNSTVTYVYDNLNNVISTTDGRNNTTHYQYDRYGNNTQITDALGNITVLEYDSMNNLVKETNALSQEKNYTYDLYGNLLTVQQSGATYSYIYDVSGNLINETHPSSETKSYQYDLYGNLTRFTDQSGLYETYVYDILNRLTSKTDRKGVTTTYAYDTVGNLTSESVGATVTEYTYNANNQLTQIEINDVVSQSVEYTTYGEISAIDYGGGYRVEYLYDYCGNKTRVQFLGEQILYTYDEMNRVSTVTNNGVVTTYAYDLNGNTTSVETGDNISSVYTFNALNLPLTQVNTVGLSSETNSYTYDDLGRVTQKNENGIITSYTYDDLGRLATVTEGSRLTTYAYDANSNRVSKTVTENGATLTESYVYDVCDRLTSLDSNGVVTTYVYDNNGNQISVTQGADVDTFVYDGKNRLISTATNGVETADFAYYADGLRKTKDGELYIYDGKNVLAEIDNTDIRLNVYGNTLLFTIQGTITTENEVTFVNGKIAYAYEFNLHGDVVKVLGIAGIVLNTYTYDAFGVITSQSATVANTFYYAGYQYDDETGLYYLRSRYYNAETARFITEDNFKGYYNDPLSLNRYTYCHNSPIIYFDPDGFRACDITAYTEIEGYSKEEILEITIERIKEENELVYALAATLNFLLETEAAEEVIVNRFEICDKRELDILRYTSQKLLDSLTYICDEETIKIIQQDLELIDYDVYNADAKKVLNSQLISYYKGQLIIRVDLAFLDDRSFSFGAMYLSTNEKSNEEGVETVMHEYGHYVQLQKLGMNKYIYYIAIPSATNKNPENYYSQPWERTADIFGGITSRSDGYIVNSDIEAYEYLNNAIYNTIFYNIINSIFNKE